ncbi:MAG: dehydrogenase, partial [Nitrososphaeraceae archaeon]|nr:dehydrogenase [Nitrososphaeraceae archaeon]
DGHCEIGPNAVPVFGAYAYNLKNNFTEVMPRIKKLMLKHGFWSLLLDREFLSLISTEVNSSFSKRSMINRVKRFLPLLDPKKFTKRGLSGIRSVIINNHGNIIPETFLLKNTTSLNILNYNSPGATGGLPMAAMIVSELINDGFAQKNEKENVSGNNNNNLWDIEEIYSRIKS